MTSQVHEFKMEMTCDGCAGAAKRVLSKIGVEDVSVDVPNKLVVITTDVTQEKLEEALKKTGKTITYLGTQKLNKVTNIYFNYILHFYKVFGGKLVLYCLIIDDCMIVDTDYT